MFAKSSHFRNLAITCLCTGALIYTGQGSPAFAGESPKTNQETFATGRLLVKGKPGLKDGKFLEILARHSVNRARKINGAEVNVVTVPPGLEKKIQAELQADPSIDFVELDHLIQPDFVPNDPSFGSQWHHSKIGSAAAWDGSSANGITIAILDSGTNGNHPDLAAAMVPGWNTISLNTDSSDVNGHGTATAGVAAAIVNNATGVSGVAKDAKIMAVRITNDPTGYAYWSDITNGVTYAADHGARVVSNSYASHVSSSVQSAAQYLNSKGGLMVNSAGNTNADDGSVDAPYMLTVAATDSNDAKASFSTFGACVDVAAPGVGILTTNNAGGYSNWNGTSFSAPMTAGLAALIMGVNSNLSPKDVETIIETSAVDLGTTGKDVYFGYGRINAAAAVTLAKTYTPAVIDTKAPTVGITTPTAGSSVKGLVPVDVAASDNIGVSKVDFYVNGALYATDSIAPYSFSWDTTSLGNASPTLTAKAYDAAGNVGTSAAVKVNVGNVSDISAPRITIVSPTNGVTLSANATIKATATDDLAVSSMAVLIDGKQVATAATGTISYSWNVRKAGSGAHTIVVKASDPSMNTSQASVSVTVK